MELKRYLNIVVRWWWLVLASFLIVLVAGFAFSFTKRPMYRSTTTLIVSPRASITELSSVRQSLDTLEKPSILNTYAEIIRSKSIYKDAVINAAIPASSQTPVDIIVTVIQKTNLIRIDAEGPNPQTVFTIANAVTENAMQYVNNLYEVYEIKVLDPAVMPAQPYSPDILRDTLLAAAIGIIFGITLSFFAEYLKKPLDTLDQLSILDRETGLFNKRFFLQRVKEETHRTRRNKRPLAVCLINLKNADDTDDAYSKQTVQLMRRRVIAFIKRHFRQDEVLARWDGENLAWLLLDTSASAAQQAVERLGGLLEEKVFEDDETGAVFTYNANFAAVVSGGDLPEKELMALCEQNLRQAKASGSNAVQVSEAPISAPVNIKPGQAGRSI